MRSDEWTRSVGAAAGSGGLTGGVAGGRVGDEDEGSDAAADDVTPALMVSSGGVSVDMASELNVECE